MLSGGTSQHLPGVPTVSHALHPGPYHKANAQLREQLPHYNVDVNVHTRWDHVFLWFMAVIIWAVYIGIRLYYLVSGKTAAFAAQNTSVAYSYVVLMGEGALGLLGFYGQQNFWKQDVRFSAMDSETLKHISQDTTMNAVRQTVHVLITTYTEPAVTVKECVVRCLVSPEPIYMEKHIYVCDDGHAKSEGPRKRAMVEELRVLGVFDCPSAMFLVLNQSSSTIPTYLAVFTTLFNIMECTVSRCCSTIPCCKGYVALQDTQTCSMSVIV